MPAASLDLVRRCTECGRCCIPACDEACPTDLRGLCAACSNGILEISRRLLEHSLRQARETGIPERPIEAWPRTASRLRRQRTRSRAIHDY